MRELTGKVAVVTGGASGIGRALAERFVREGMKIVLADVEEKALAETRDMLAASGASVLAVRTDVSQAEQVEELARRTFDAFGTAHVVCNNAGVSVAGPAWQPSEADYRWVLGVNLWGVIHGIRAFVPRLVSQGEGHVVNTASIAGLISAPGMGPYCATKHAVVALSECLFHDLAIATSGKVNVSVLCPAWVNTRIAESDRNRPASAPRRERERTPHEQRMEGLVKAAVAGGIPAHVVAEKVLRAIVEQKFWILTHSKTKKGVERRMCGVIDDTDPANDAVPE
jgi:NAD(P)-dependent dehydrogenase (short-subunit alcohol dehydrogenase family)